MAYLYIIVICIFANNPNIIIKFILYSNMRNKF